MKLNNIILRKENKHKLENLNPISRDFVSCRSCLKPFNKSKHRFVNITHRDLGLETLISDFYVKKR